MVCADCDTTFVHIDLMNGNASLLGLLNIGYFEQQTESDDYTYKTIIKRGNDGKGLFWLCPGIYHLALVRIQLVDAVPLPSRGRRLQSTFFSEGIIKIFTWDHAIFDDGHGFADVQLPKEWFTVIVDEHFLWPDLMDPWYPQVEWSEGQIMYTLYFLPSPGAGSPQTPMMEPNYHHGSDYG